MKKSTSKIKPLRLLAIAVLTSLSSACTTLGPDYERPPVDVPDSYTESSETSEIPSSKSDKYAQWWGIYHDQTLDNLMPQISKRNYSLQGAFARLRQARESRKIAEAAQYLDVIVGGKNNLGIIANWEVDLWGRIKRDIEASGAAEQASAADLAKTKLLLQAELAKKYFLLRVQDSDIELLENTITAYQRSLKITRNQYKAGVAERSSVTQAKLQLSSTQVQMYDARLKRARLEHTIAVLVGRAPADFSIATSTINTKKMGIPQVPALLPSTLLERRPDIAAAERRMAAASANIGVAAAAAYPTIDLFAGVTIRKGLVGGADVEAPIYTAGATTAIKTKAEAVFDEAIANYRQVVLKALREIEDNLATLQSLRESSEVQFEASKAAREAVLLIKNQYQAGIVSYLEVAILQSLELDSERTSLSILGGRLVASVNLIKALGGGWQASELKKETEENLEDRAEDLPE